MKSAWFWNTERWAQYQQAYWAGRTRPDEFKTSPLGDGDDFTYPPEEIWTFHEHETQVIDLTVSSEHLWRGVRRSYHQLIHRAQDRYVLLASDAIACYAWVHAEANGGVPPRPAMTYECQDRWLGEGLALLVEAWQQAQIVAAAYWIVYQGCAYYMSGPSITRNVQHAVIWRSLELLKANGVRLAELGQIDGETDKEKSIGQFKRGFGGYVAPFTIATRRTA